MVVPTGNEGSGKFWQGTMTEQNGLKKQNCCSQPSKSDLQTRCSNATGSNCTQAQYWEGGGRVRCVEKNGEFAVFYESVPQIYKQTRTKQDRLRGRQILGTSSEKINFWLK
jgi:hypothetical protein